MSSTGEVKSIIVVVMCSRNGKASTKNPSIKNNCPFIMYFIRKSALIDKDNQTINDNYNLQINTRGRKKQDDYDECDDGEPYEYLGRNGHFKNNYHFGHRRHPSNFRRDQEGGFDDIKFRNDNDDHDHMRIGTTRNKNNKVV